jgi:acetyltransferase-like isoleucine patch superfamily enzyme
MKFFKSLIRRLYYLNSFRKFKSVGSNILLSFGGTIIRPEEITFGNNIFISRGFHISARDLKFGNNIMIGPNLVIECDNHFYDKPGIKMFETQNHRKVGSVKIEDDVWIGANVTILPNTIIREGSIIGAGSIVVKTLPPYTVCVGNPCHPIKARFSLENLNTHLQNISSNYSVDVIKKYWEEYKLI